MLENLSRICNDIRPQRKYEIPFGFRVDYIPRLLFKNYQIPR